MEIEELFELEEESTLRALCQASRLQSASGMIARWRSQRLARYLIDDEGKLDLGHLKRAQQLLEYEIVAPGGIHDVLIMQHMRQVLAQVEELWKSLRSIGLPLCHERAEEIVAAGATLIDADVKRAILSALLCPLRQSVGSCFATAPAILIHSEMPQKCLEDLIALLTKGELTRTFGGEAFSVPFCPSPGIGDLKRPLSAEMIASPGIMEALVAAELIDPELSLGEKLSASKRLTTPFLEKAGTPLELIRALLLERFDLSEETLASSRKFEQQAVRGEVVTQEVGALHHIGDFRKAFEKAKLAFVSFADSPLLKCWEFTLASVCDVKTEFSRWNLFSSLGLHPEEKGGIGALIYEHLEERLLSDNEKIEEYQREYEIAFDQVRATELLLGKATGEDEARRLKIEHQSRLHHMYACQELRDKHHEDAQRWSEFFSFILEQYSIQFPKFFQEVYDPEMQEVLGTEYDDSPAGFRLLYKHGRAHVGSWTFIKNAEEWTQSLVDFFTSSEGEILAACEWDAGKFALGHITTKAIHLMRSEDFLRSAFFRLARAHRVPLKTISIEALEQLEKKPWAYTSGGTMQTLLKTYFRREGSISEEARYVDSPLDLCSFFLDTLKMLPPFVTDPLEENPDKRMLATSPSHAFSFLPGRCFLRSGWSTRRFTYTWVRDEIYHPTRRFYEAISFAPSEQAFLMEQLSGQSVALSSEHLSIKELREKIPLESALIDAFFFESLPLIPEVFAKKIAHQLAVEISSAPEYMTRRAFIEMLVQCAIEKKGRILKEDLYEKIVKEMEKMNLSPPPPFIIADTNWHDHFFAFVTSPGTLEFDLWRCDRLGIQGHPMSEWSMHLDGTTQEKWGLYLRPFEYS